MSSSLPSRFPLPQQPLAYAMWDFSWLERRAPGGGYDDWQRVLDELVERGYNALRIDPYPHLLSAGTPTATLEPVWTVHDWGSSTAIDVQPRDALILFLKLCQERGLRVGLSTWFRQDRENLRLRIKTPADHARVWLDTLRLLRSEGVVDVVDYVDLCNEFPGDLWAPFFDNRPDSSWNCMTERALGWMEAAVGAFRTVEPQVPVTYSVVGFDPAVRERWQFLDLLEPHIWMAQASNFIEQVGANYNNFDTSGYEALAARGEATYRADPLHWQQALRQRIQEWAAVARVCQRPLVTTECWAVVNYREAPGLNWSWIKELCELGVEEALSTGCWCGVATSNFCGPQFPGMWNDVAWHRRLTQRIRQNRVTLTDVANQG